MAARNREKGLTQSVILALIDCVIRSNLDATEWLRRGNTLKRLYASLGEYLPFHSLIHHRGNMVKESKGAKKYRRKKRLDRFKEKEMRLSEFLENLKDRYKPTVSTLDEPEREHILSIIRAVKL